MMLKAFAFGLGLPDDYFDEKFAAPRLALLHYPPHPADTDSWGVGPHTDYDICTFYYIGGLEVEVTEGQWIKAKPIPGSSDMFSSFVLVEQCSCSLSPLRYYKFQSNSFNLGEMKHVRYSSREWTGRESAKDPQLGLQ